MFTSTPAVASDSHSLPGPAALKNRIAQKSAVRFAHYTGYSVGKFMATQMRNKKQLEEKLSGGDETMADERRVAGAAIRGRPRRALKMRSESERELSLSRGYHNCVTKCSHSSCSPPKKKANITFSLSTLIGAAVVSETLPPPQPPKREDARGGSGSAFILARENTFVFLYTAKLVKFKSISAILGNANYTYIWEPLTKFIAKRISF